MGHRRMKSANLLLSLVSSWPALVAASEVPRVNAQVVFEETDFVRLSISVSRAQFPVGTTHCSLRFREPWPAGSVDEFVNQRVDSRTGPFEPRHTLPSGPTFTVALRFRLPWGEGRRTLALSRLLPLVYDEAGNELHLPLSLSFESRGHTRLTVEGAKPIDKKLEIADLFELVHYVRDPASGRLRDFKFKKHSTDSLGTWTSTPEPKVGSGDPPPPAGSEATKP